MSMKYSPWTELRRTKIHRLHEAIAAECLTVGRDYISTPNLKELARHILDHPSKTTMYDYFEDMEDSRWISIEETTVRLLKIPESLKEQFKQKGPLLESVVVK